MDTGLTVFILILAIIVFSILSQAKDRSGKKIGLNAGRLTLYGFIYIGSFFVVGLISFLVPHLLGLKGTVAQAMGIVIGLFGLFTAVPYVGEWIERREGARERKQNKSAHATARGWRLSRRMASTFGRKMNKAFENIGRCLLVCQTIEQALCTILLMERKQKFVHPSEIAEEYAQLRADLMSGLKKRLEREGHDFFDPEFLTAIIRKRNWLCHRLVFDPRLVAFAKGEDDFTDVVRFFDASYGKVASVLRWRMCVHGVEESAPTSDSDYKNIKRMSAEAQERVKQIRKET